MKKQYRFPLHLQMFAEDDDHEDADPGDDLDEEVIGGEHEDHSSHGGGHRHSAGGVGIHEALDQQNWEKFLDLVKMQNEKMDQHLSELRSKLEDLDRRHQAIPASVRAEIESLFEAHKAAGTIDDADQQTEPRKSKYSRH